MDPDSAFILFDLIELILPGRMNRRLADARSGSRPTLCRLSSLQECREEQTLKSFDRDRGTLRLGLKDRALQRRNQEAGEFIAVALG